MHILPCSRSSRLIRAANADTVKLGPEQRLVPACHGGDGIRPGICAYGEKGGVTAKSLLETDLLDWKASLPPLP